MRLKSADTALALPPARQEISMKDDIVIVGAARTPVGAFNGAFAQPAGP